MLILFHLVIVWSYHYYQYWVYPQYHNASTLSFVIKSDPNALAKRVRIKRFKENEHGRSKYPRRAG